MVRGFNPRPRMGGDIYTGSLADNKLGFNPRPRMGGDPSNLKVSRRYNVSIHAPAWGATPAILDLLVVDFCFNPRPRMGGDQFLLIMADWLLVSIHAPAWGATNC